MITYNETLRPFESCSDRRVPVIELGSGFLQHCTPTISSLQDYLKADRKLSQLDQVTDEEWRRADALLDQMSNKLETS